jgi:fructuronate reductase
VASSEEGEARVRALLGLRQIFGDDLADNADLVARLTACYQQLTTQGARATVQQYMTRA